MELKLTQVDAFTPQPFRGNPAAVCVHDHPLDESLMQAIALEMNVSETAFLHPEPEAEGWRLRWFTPAVEVKLCGHATLASAHVLWSQGYLPPATTAQFHTLSGQLTATQQDGWITLNFPATPATATEGQSDILKALDLNWAQTTFVGKTQFDLLVEVESEEEVRSLSPDFGRLRSLPIRGIIVTSVAKAGADYDFVSRFFAPGSGIDEDPVTGSAHCCLAPYWQAKLGRADLVGYQASARGGYVKVKLEGDRVLLSGQAVTTLTGSLSV